FKCGRYVTISPASGTPSWLPLSVTSCAKWRRSGARTVRYTLRTRTCDAPSVMVKLNATSCWSGQAADSVTRNAPAGATAVPYAVVAVLTTTLGSDVDSVALTPVAEVPPVLTTGMRRSITSPASQMPSASPLVPPTASSSITGGPSPSTAAADAVTLIDAW